MNDKEFKPYIPAEKITPEMTATSVIMGCPPCNSFLVQQMRTWDCV